MPTTAFDDKSEHCIPFILECLDAHRTRYAEQRDGPSPNQPPPPPLFLGVNGIQGSGKTTLVGV
jgi:D-glycerate 3-kinase